MNTLGFLKKRSARRVVIGVAAFAAASLFLAGCSSSSTSSGSSSKLRIVDVAALITDSFFVTGKCGAQDAAKKLGVSFEFEGPTSNSATAEEQAFAAAAATNPDGMLLAPFSNTGFSGTVGPLMKKGVPVVATGQSLTPPDAYATMITNYLKAAKPLESIIGKLSGGKGTVGLIADSTGNTTDSDRYTQLVPALEAKYPSLKVLSPQYAQNSTPMAATIAAALIQGNPDMSVIYASSGPEAVGAASAIKAAGDTSKIKLVSFDSSPQQITLLKDGELAATIGQSPYKSSYIAVQKVVAYLKAHPGSKKPVPATAALTGVPTTLLTPDNVNTAAGKKYQYMTKCD